MQMRKGIKMRKMIILLLMAMGMGIYLYTTVDIHLLLSGATTSNSNMETFVQDQGTIDVYFCPREDCENTLIQFINTAEESVHCALFDIGLKSIQNVLDEKAAQLEVQIVTDNDYVKKYNRSFVKTDSWSLMHNKFCIIDGTKVSTGSMNPTDNDAHKNNNNLLFISSQVLAQNYEDEFQEMWNDTFKKGNPVRQPTIMLGNILLANYFCPEDYCADKVKEELEKAEESIYFMTFSFTNEGIANVILLKHLENMTMQGVMETRQISEHSQFMRLNYSGIDVVKDGNKNNLHHKVFIIDEETVVTGSFNPTGSGDKRNDENILIIKDKEIVRQFKEEFDTVYAEAKALAS